MCTPSKGMELQGPPPSTMVELQQGPVLPHGLCWGAQGVLWDWGGIQGALGVPVPPAPQPRHRAGTVLPWHFPMAPPAPSPSSYE